MDLVWAEPAIADRRAIFEYIETNDPLAAVKMDSLFVERAKRLLGFPHAGRPGRVPGTRELLAHPSYILHYMIDGTTIRILAVVHTSRNWPVPRT